MGSHLQSEDVVLDLVRLEVRSGKPGFRQDTVDDINPALPILRNMP